MLFPGSYKILNQACMDLSASLETMILELPRHKCHTLLKCILAPHSCVGADIIQPF